MPDREDEVGALWLKESKAGKKFMSGRFITPHGDTIDVVVFKNDRKQPGERTPDYRVYRSQPRDEQPRGRTPVNEPIKSMDELDDEIPFAWLGALIVPWALALLSGGGGVA